MLRTLDLFSSLSLWKLAASSTRPLAKIVGGIAMGVSLFIAHQTLATDDLPKKPVIAEASDEGRSAIGGFKIPEGWKCELFAAEPDLANPVAFYVDNKGRVFVCESFRQNKGVTDNRGHDLEWQMADQAAQTVQDRIDYHKRLLPDKGASYVERGRSHQTAG